MVLTDGPLTPEVDSMYGVCMYLHPSHASSLQAASDDYVPALVAFLCPHHPAVQRHPIGSHHRPRVAMLVSNAPVGRRPVGWPGRNWGLLSLSFSFLCFFPLPRPVRSNKDAEKRATGDWVHVASAPGRGWDARHLQKHFPCVCTYILCIYLGA